MDLKTRNQHRTGIEVAALAGVEAAGVSPCELNAINFGDTLWSLRACTGIVLVFQAIYLAADWSWIRVHDDAILPLHISNILNAAIFLRLTHIRTYRDHMPQFILGGWTLIFATTAALSVLTLNPAPLTITVTITIVGVAALVPWNWRWQAALSIAAASSMTAFTLLRPSADPHLVYDWLAIVSAAGVAHYAVVSGERYRREIINRMTQREQALRKLADSESKMRRLFEVSPDSISIARMSDGMLIAVNQSLCAMTGLTAEEMIGRRSIETQIWDDPTSFKNFARRLRDEGCVRDFDAVLRHRSGQLIPHSVSGVVTELGGELCAISIAHNMTKRKRVERDLEDARKAALAASQAKSEFLSSMSHEIRTPMNAILGMADLLKATPLNLEQKKYLTIMSSNGDALLELINGILDLARIESGRMSLEQAGFDLESVVDSAIETMAVRAHEKGLEMLAHVLPDVPLQRIGDRLRLRQILINLLGNAVKFTEHGQVLLTVECDRASAQVGALHFSVADTGIGIPPDKLESLFSNFTQVDASTTRKYGGSGLGLAIVRRLVGLMGGRIWVRSELGRGSIFHFTVNFRVHNEGLAVSAMSPQLSLDGVRVMVVDDNSANRLILREMLSSRGAEVDEAADGPSALDHIQLARTGGNPYRLMLLDCRMPGMDGFEVAKRLKAGADQDLTVLMLSSDDLQLELSRAHELGLDLYLVKPVRRTDLFETIGTAMARHPASAEVVKESAATAAIAPLMTARNSEPSLNILLADDSKVNRFLISMFLKDSGYCLDEAENGAIAVAKMNAGNYDLVLMDIQMPVMDGLEATRAIRAWESEHHLPRTPIIALTASALDEDVSRIFAAGIDMHLSKPIKKETLINTISKLSVARVTARELHASA